LLDALRDLGGLVADLVEHDLLELADLFGVEQDLHQVGVLLEVAAELARDARARGPVDAHFDGAAVVALADHHGQHRAVGLLEPSA
jgi:hypothetical protein